MTAKADLSVVIPVRDGAPLLEFALRSVYAQSLPPAEVIVVDDHSSDQPERAVARFPGTILLHSDGEGAAAARNAGARKASRRWLAFLDADDLWPPLRTAALLARLEAETGLEFACGSARQFREGPTGAKETLGPPMATKLPTAAVMSREAFARVGEFSGRWAVGETIEWWSRALDAGLRHAAIPDLVLWRRVHERNLGRRAQQPGQAYVEMLHEVLERRRRSGLA